MAASEGQQPVPPILSSVAPEPGELDQISIMIPGKLYLKSQCSKCLPISGANAAHPHVLALRDSAP